MSKKFYQEEIHIPWCYRNEIVDDLLGFSESVMQTDGSIVRVVRKPMEHALHRGFYVSAVQLTHSCLGRKDDPDYQKEYVRIVVTFMEA
jgi:hypothetical protein